MSSNGFVGMDINGFCDYLCFVFFATNCYSDEMARAILGHFESLDLLVHPAGSSVYCGSLRYVWYASESPY